MRENCLDIGTIQAFLDGELASDLMETAAHHLSVCNECALNLATAEEETAVAFSALDQELNTLVPTHRLWTKINDSIERERKSFWHSIFAFFKNPTIGAFASFLVVFALFLAYLNWGKTDSGYVAINETKKTQTAERLINPVSVKSDDESETAGKPEKIIRTTSTTEQNGKNYRLVSANLDTGEVKRKTLAANLIAAETPKTRNAVYEYIPGEESYIKTIVSLEKAIDGSKNRVLDASGQFNLARNLAVVDDAINKMKSEVKKNPKNESAKQLLMASYQNKVDILNSVAEKNELMASIK